MLFQRSSDVVDYLLWGLPLRPLEIRDPPGSIGLTKRLVPEKLSLQPRR